MENIDKKYMTLAIEEAKKAKIAGDLPFGAVIVHEDKVVSVGRAENNTTGDVTAHAELQAVQRACKALGINDLRNCTIYATNEPCVMCGGSIFQAKIQRIVIGVSRGELEGMFRVRKIGFRDLVEDSGYQAEIVKGVLKDQIIELFKDAKKF